MSATDPYAGLGDIDPSLLIPCTIDICSISTSFYNYRIDRNANIALSVVFGVAMLVYFGIWIATRRAHFFNAVMIIGLAVEVLGYAARVWSYDDQWALTPYLIQIICLTLGPAFFSAAVYVCLGKIVVIYGKENSWLKPLTYTYIFIPCDALALILQAVGGGIAAASLATYSFAELQEGTNIMTAGLVWQVFTLLCFMSLCIAFFARVWHSSRKLGVNALCQDEWAVDTRRSRRFKLFLPALTLATILIFWRCVFRVVELNAGFHGPVTSNQGLFIGFEGVIIAVAVYLLAACHPALCMRDAFATHICSSDCQCASQYIELSHRTGT